MGKKKRKTTIVLLLLVGWAVPSATLTVMGAGELYVNPGITQAQTVGTSFSILVKVASMDQFDGWDIQVVSDQSVINATSITITGNIFQKNFTGGFAIETVNCINGAGKGCCLTNACSPHDGPGIAHSGFIDQKEASGSGLLFNITFQVVSDKGYSPISIQNDLISNGGQNNGVAHTTYNGYYGTAPDFNMIASPSSIDVTEGSSNVSTITLTSLRTFSGTITLTPGSAGNGITVSLNTTTTILTADSISQVLLSVQTQENTSATSYTVTLNATSNSRSHSIPITVSVKPNGDFTIGADPADLLTHQSSSNSTTVTVKSLNHFTGTVNIQVIAFGATASLDNTELIVPDGGSVSTILRVTTQSSDTRFRDNLNIIATSGPLHHSFLVIAEPPPGDFSVTLDQAYAKVQVGYAKTTVSIRVTSLDYYVGTIYLLGTSQSGLGLTFDPSSFYLNHSQAIFAKLTVIIGPETAVGNHTIQVAVLGEFGQVTQHSLLLTLIVTPRTFLGLQEPAFLGVFGGIGVVLALLGVLESRRSKRLKGRPILER